MRRPFVGVPRFVQEQPWHLRRRTGTARSGRRRPRHAPRTSCRLPGVREAYDHVGDQPVQPVWCDAPSPAPVSPWKYSWNSSDRAGRTSTRRRRRCSPRERCPRRVRSGTAPSAATPPDRGARSRRRVLLLRTLVSCKARRGESSSHALSDLRAVPATHSARRTAIAGRASSWAASLSCRACTAAKPCK
jgi:hypothetical protein